jgi:prepilin-type N-terminal cleavage/methylation domain-containing protein
MHNFCMSIFFLKRGTSKKQKGFTMIEILLSFAIIGLIAGMTMPMYRTFMIRNDLDVAVSTVAQNLRRAQALAVSSDGDMTWGLHVGVGGILIFKGPSYVLRNDMFDENTSMPTSIVPSGLTEVVFSKVTGIPQATGTFILTSQANEERTITINEKGTIEY